MEARVVGHVIHDGWEVKYRETALGKDVTEFFEPYFFEIIRNLLNRENIETQSIVYYAKRFPVAEGPGTVRDMGRFYERRLTKDELATVTDEWLETTRKEIKQLDDEQIARWLPEKES